jgi:hypothetical protein
MNTTRPLFSEMSKVYKYVSYLVGVFILHRPWRAAVSEATIHI